MKIVGHRGARGLAPENTEASLRAALAHNVDEIEIDVRVTKDGQTILNHDPKLHAREADLLIRKYTFDELQLAKPDSIGLEDAIRITARRVRLMVEVKPRQPVAPVVNVFRKLLGEGWEPSDFIIGSFSQRTLKALHKELPDFPIVVIGKFSGMRARWRARQLQTRVISMNHHSLWFGFIKFMTWRGYKLYTYTLNDASRARKWARAGLHGAITDHPEYFKER